MYDIEDITENIDDGFTWLSVIHNMNAYRVQLSKSSHSDGHMNVLHVYDTDGEELGEEHNEELEQAIKNYFEKQ